MALPHDILRALQDGSLSLDDAERQLAGRGAAARVNGASPHPAPTDGSPGAAPSRANAGQGAGRIAVVGMSGRYPGAEDLDALWRNLAEGRCAVREIPPSRWDVRPRFQPLPVQPGRIYCKWMGMLDDVESFDPLFFGISPGEAELMDPQHRIFLEEAYRALEDAGCAGRAIGAARCGVYLGIMGNEYLTMLHARCGDAVNATGNSFAIAAARLSYFLDLKGPAIAVDTACSSSLVATHLACRALLGGEIDLAVVGGVSLYLSPMSYVGMCAAGMLSPDGACRAFDDGANGFVPGEGAGALVLKRLEDAEADGDAIHGVIAGTAVNQDGRTNGITAPSVTSQIAVEREAYARSGVDPRDVTYVEMHGTGTKLGDPVELEALATVFAERGVGPGRCAIGSLKTNVGHTSAAAGVASLQKVLLSIRHGQIPPSLHFTKPNEHFDLARSPFRVATALEAWPVSGAPRRAAVSAFGFSGTNAHLVIEEYVPARAGAGRVAPAPGPFLFPISARSEERLRAVAGRLAAWLEATGDVALAELAYSLQAGRDGMQHRAAFVASTRDEVQRALRGLAAGTPPRGVLAGHGRKGGEEVALLEQDEDAERLLRSWLEKGKLDRLAALWVRGLDVDWRRIHPAQTPRRLHLPTYPFLRQRCWLPVAEEPGPRVGASAGILHPLVHRNASDAFELRYTAAFTGEEPELQDHRVAGRRVMSGAALVEMARAAAAQALRAGDALRLEEVRWIRPLVVEGGSIEVEVRLAPEGPEAFSFEIRSAGSDEADGGALHATGRVRRSAPAEAPRVDLAALRAACAARVLTAAECYATFEAAGLAYGPSHRGIERIEVGDGEALARLTPAGAPQDGVVLPPGLLDSALQAALGVASPAAARAPLPVALDVLEIHGGCAAARWAHVRCAGAGGEGEQRFDVELCEDSGRVCARVGGFTVRAHASEAPAASAGQPPLAASGGPAPGGRDVDGLVTLAPVWDAVRPGDHHASPPGGVAVVVGGDAAARAAVLEVLPGARVLEPGDLDEDALAGSLSALGDVGHLVWMVPGGEAPGLAAVPGEQRRGVIQLFRLARAALRAGLGARRLDWTVATRLAARVHRGSRIDPTHAAVHGFMGSLAKEHPRWRVRVVDLEGLDGAPWPELLALPPDPAGDVLARRGGAWLRRKLVPVEPPPRSGPPPYRAGGVYVVVGGAGGLGEVWTEHVLRQHQAHVVWLGRRPLDAGIQARIDRLGALGPAPIYVQADARDRVALEEAYQAVKQRFARVHGVVHAALELRDQGLAQMKEDAFLAALTAKVDGCVRVAELFRNDALDFLLFFSSAQSFQNAAGQANYAAGCAFEDALALRLGSEWPCPVKVMNWGFWGEHGAVATAAHRERMARAGIASIAPAEGMAALDALLAGPLDQVAFLKTARPVSPDGVDGSERLALLPEVAPAALRELERELAPTGGEALAAAEAAHRAELDAVLAPVLGAQLLALGVDEEALRSGAAADRVRHPFHRRWLDRTVSVLGLRGSGGPTLPRGAARDAALSAWDARRAVWARDPGRRAEVELADRMLRALPEVLTGRRGAAEVMFEGEGLEQVQGLYRGNPIADAMNATVAAAVTAHVRRRVEHDAAARVRVLEIGGGTGGTTGAVLAALEPYRANLDAYLFTDLSPTFLARAEEAWRGAHPYLSTARLDVSAPLDGQGLAGGFDVVVAANVLHATRDVRGAVRNVKAALRRHGLLAACEISDWTLFTHVTVGLLEGWWLADDRELRIPGSPGLTPERWAELLAQEGFAVAFPARAAHGTGQQVVLAESDGRVRHRAAPCVGSAAPGPAALAPAIAAPPAPVRETVAVEDGASCLEPYVRETVLALLARSLKVDAGEIDLEDAFANYGLDSITGVQLVQRLDEELGVELTPTDLFDHGSVRRLTAFLVARFGEELARRRPAPPPAAGAAAGAGGGDAPAGASERAAAPGLPARALATPPRARRAVVRPELRGARARGAGPIAVVGMSGRFAGSPDLDALWAHLAAGDDLVGEVARWDLSGIHRGKRHCRHGSFVDDIDCFDPLFFRISATEARYMDPQQRLFLEEAWKALEDAGHAGIGDAARACGVFVGCSGGDYQSLFRGEPPPQAFWGNAGSIVPARIAYHLDLQGPAITVDTACSSSLVAVHLACQSLWSGETDLALAGGVFLQATPYFFVSAERAGMLSHGGRCFAFDDRADGFVPGEGVGVVALKRLADALADGDHVHAVIRGSGTNQDGATNGITAPSARAQERLERHVYDTFGVDPGRIQLVEAHGTGTKLGDPIEVDALNRAFRASTAAVGACALGSIKTNLGHAAAAAGIAGLLKVILALRHRQLPPSLHFRSANPKVRLDGSPFYVNTSLRPWEDLGGPRLAAVSSFGFSGTNAHVVVEEAPPRARAPGARREYLVPLSARTPQQLRALAAGLARHCARHPELELADVSHTLAQGRKHLEHRLACVASDRAELVDRLDRWLAGKGDAGVCTGEARLGAEGVATRQVGAGAAAQGRAERLGAAASSFVAGGGLALDVLLDGERRGRVPLPTHPFARERYWATGGTPAPSTGAAAAVHPLLRPGPPSETGARFLVHLSGREPFVADHRVGGRSVLPGVAFLELARAAGACAGRAVTGLTGISWVKPLVVPDGGIDVEVVLEIRGAGPELPFQVRATASAGEPIVYAEGGLAVGESARGDVPVLDLAAVEARCTARFDAGACYARLQALGLDLGPSLRPIEALRVGPAEVLADLELPEAAGADPRLVLHPALMDGGLQCGIGLELGGASDGLHVPFALERVELLGALPRSALAHLVVTGEGAARRASVQIADRSGRVAVRLEGLVVRPLASRTPEVAATPSPDAVILERVWEPEPPPPGAGEPAGGRVIVVIERDGGLADAVRRALPAGSGAQVLSAVAAPERGAAADGPRALRPDRAAEPERLLEQVAGAPGCVTLVHAVGLASGGGEGARADVLAAAALGTATSLLGLVREARRRFPDARVEVVALVPGPGAEGAPAAAVSGLARSLALELPRLGAKTVELAGAAGAPSPEALVSAAQEIVAGAPDLAEISWRDGTRRRAAWRELPIAPRRDGAAFGEGRTYLVTGGMGAIGTAVAQHLARRPGTRLVLCGRSALDEAGEAQLRELTQLGAEALHVQADVSRPEDVARLVEVIHERFGPLHGVLHAAGELRDGAASTKTEADLEAVLAAKVRGTVLLDEATRGEPLELFVGFSSLAAVTGNVGQADYAYANAFMDVYLRARAGRAQVGERTGRSVSIAWPPWRSGGMRLSAERLDRLRSATGLAPLETGEALALLDAAVASGPPVVLILAGDRARVGELVRRDAASRAGAPPAREPGREPSASPRGPEELLREVLRVAAAVAGLDEGALSPDRSLADYGLDSLGFSTLAQRLGAGLGSAISPATFFEFPTARAVAAHLAAEVELRAPRAIPAPISAPAPARDERPAGATAPPLARRATAEPVAIVGIGGVMPGSRDLHAFWEHLEAGHDLVTEVPPDRWERAGFAAALARAGEAGRRLHGAFVDDIDRFDALFFGISPREAELMDPQQRILLETAWRAVEDAGYRMSDLAGTRTGVFVGASTADYADVVRASGVPIEGHMATGLAPSVLANRISFLFDLRGPSEPVDTACSSALVALHRAVDAVATGACELALAGGVNALLTPGVFISFLKAGMLSPDGRCKTFDRRANGYVRGEGAGAVLVKPLRRAEADGDHVYAVVRGSAVNHGGRASSFTVPSMTAQADVLVQAYERAGVDPGTVGYIEAHGTGTALGDPIEVDGLKRAFAELSRRRGARPTVATCGLGSVKSNVGHLEAAAGMAGLLKILLALRHGTLPPTLHFRELNPHIRLDESPFYVVGARRAWAPARDVDGRPLPRRAGVSSFGFGGANAHVVLEEHVTEASPAPVDDGPQVVPLSARSAERLVAQARGLLEHLDRAAGAPPAGAGAGDLTLAALAYTLQVGREPFEHRFAAVVESLEDLRAQLRSFCAGAGLDPARGFTGCTAEGRAAGSAEGVAEADGALAARDLPAIAARWVSGVAVEWGRLHARPRRRLSLPTYPFARDRHWVEGAVAAEAERSSQGAEARAGGEPPEAARSWRARLAGAGAAAARREVLAAYLVEEISRMLKLGPERRLDPGRPLVAVGFDSLMALQLRKKVATELELDVSLVRLLGGESAAELADRILAGGVDPAQAGVPLPPVIGIGAGVDDVLEGVL